MRAFWRGVLFLLVFSFALLAIAARFPVFDPVTADLPRPLRSAVATLAVHENVGVDPDPVTRALALDPENAAAWSRRCTAFMGMTPGERLADCRHAVALHPTTADLRAFGSALEDQGEFCGAEDAYRRALDTPEAAGQRPLVLREEARAALTCGDMNGSLSALRAAAAIDLHEAESLETAPPAVRESLSNDHGYMSVVYQRMQQPDRANEECVAANPGLSACSCTLTLGGLSCTASGPILDASMESERP